MQRVCPSSGVSPTVLQRFQTQWRAHTARAYVRNLKKAKAAKAKALREKKAKAMDLVRAIISAQRVLRAHPTRYSRKTTGRRAQLLS